MYVSIKVRLVLLYRTTADELAAEPEFAYALLRFYKDVIACMGALQVVPTYLSS